MALFFQPAIRERCTPTAGRPATDIADVIESRGTFYLLGREDPYASASPLMTALAEHILDTALRLANASQWGNSARRCSPAWTSCRRPLRCRQLRTRMANERALGISIIYAAQTWRQLAALFGDTEARAIFGLTNILALFGGSKDIGFNREVSDLVGTTRVARTSWQLNGRGGRTASGEDTPILRPEEIRQLPERQALLIAENTPPVLARLRRCIDGKPGRALLDDQQQVRAELSERRRHEPGAGARAAAAIAAARKHALLDERGE